MNAIEALIAREDEFFAAQTGSDLVKLDELFAEDLVFAHTTGIVDGKASYLEGVRTGRYAHGGIHRLHGSTIVSDDQTGAVTITVVDMMTKPVGRPEVAIRIHQVIEWVPSEVGWTIVSRHATKQPL